MKTKVVYVVTSTEEDLYLYQTFLSIYSLRQKNASLIVELVVDSKTNDTLKNSRAAILDYVDKKVVVNVPKSYNKVQTSRYMKTSLREYIEGDFLFVDSDTIITDSLEEIDTFEGEIGAVPDTHLNFEQYDKKTKDIINARVKKTGWVGEIRHTYFNSGIMFVRDSIQTREFYKHWHETWKKTLNKERIHYDQPPLFTTNEEFDMIKELPGEWNCQVMNNGLVYLYKAKIIHYLANHAVSRRHADKAYKFHDKGLFEDIKKSGKISPQLATLVENAKGAFVTPCVVIVGNELELMHNGLYDLYMSLPKVYSFFDTVGGCIHSLGWSFVKIFRKYVKKETY